MADVLKRTTRANVLTTRNELTHYNQEHYKQEVPVTVEVHQRVVLSTNMVAFQEFDMSGVGTSGVFILETDRPITVAFNTTTNTLGLATNGMVMAVASVTHVYVKNNNTTYTATVEFAATD